jgi:spermidine/putrescine transport system substrate-binding protein
MMTDERTDALAALSRRRFLQGSALAGTAAFLAACGTSGTGSAAPTASAAPSAAPSGSAGASASAGATPAQGGTLRFANWIGYIDIAEDGTFPTLKKFQDETGITVNYVDGAVDDN